MSAAVPTDVFNIAAERERHATAQREAACRRQPVQCTAIQTLASHLTPETMRDDPNKAYRALIDLQTLLHRQAALLSSTAAPDHWRSAATAYFNTDRQFTLAYLDPPWRYAASNNRACGTAPHYDTMSDDELALMPVRGLMHADAALAMWTTAPKMQIAQRLLSLWGFEFRTVFLTWIKVTASGQHPIYATNAAYTRPNAEFLLLATRGKLHVTAHSHRMVDSVLETRRAEHSHKPNVVRDMLVAVFGDRTRIELFTRETVPGWHAWGKETTKFNELYARPADELVAGEDDGDISERGAKRARLLTIRPGRTRVNNRSAKKSQRKPPAPLRAGARDAGPASSTEYYNKPSDGTKMTINDFILRGYDNSEMRQFNRVTDLRALFGRVPSTAERHSTYPSLTVGEVRDTAPLLRRMQEHYDEVLFATNNNAAHRPVQYSDDEMAALLERANAPPEQPAAEPAMQTTLNGIVLTRSEAELLADEPPPPTTEQLDAIETLEL